LSDGMTKITWDKSWITCRRFKILMRNGRPETIDLLGDVKGEFAPDEVTKRGRASFSVNSLQIRFPKDRSEQLKIRGSAVQP
jgi:hypothetical protein